MISFYIWVARLCHLLSFGCSWRSIGSLTGPTFMAFVFLWRYLTLSFSTLFEVYFRNIPLPSTVVLYLWFVRSVSRYDLRRVSDLGSSSQISDTTWGADRTTLLCLYLVLDRSKLDCGAHIYCTVSRVLSVLWTLPKTRACAWRLVHFVLIL